MSALSLELDEVVNGYAKVGLRPIADYLRTFAGKPLTNTTALFGLFIMRWKRW